MGSKDELYDIPGIVEEDAEFIIQVRDAIPSLHAFVKKSPKHRGIFLKIQFDVGKLKRNKMKLFYNKTPITRGFQEKLMKQKKNDKRDETVQSNNKRNHEERSKDES